MATEQKIKILAVVGPTASGKTAVSVELAKRLGGEVVSCDSMQVYRRMNVGTAKPTEEEKCGIAHHLIDAVEPDETEDPFAEDTEDEGEAPAEVELSTPKGYLTITARDGWVEGEALGNDRLVLENPDLGVVVTITIDDFQLVSDIEQEKSIISSGYEAKEFTEYTIGDNTFERLQVSDTLNYLVTTCSTGKVIQLEIRNCALEDAESVLETIVIG